MINLVEYSKLLYTLFWYFKAPILLANLVQASVSSLDLGYYHKLYLDYILEIEIEP